MNKPYFNIKSSKDLWTIYYNATSFWNKAYCINLCFDIIKHANMKRNGNLLNLNNFFYNGILGNNLPDMQTLVDIGKYHESAIPIGLTKGQIGLSLTQQNILKECYEKQYEYVLLLEDDVSFNNDYFINLNIFLEKHKNFDVLYLGSSMYHNPNEICDVDDVIQYESLSTQYFIMKPKKFDFGKKIMVGGTFALLLSKKAIEIWYNNFKNINSISDVLLCNFCWDMYTDFAISKTRNLLISMLSETKNNLKTYLFKPDLMSQDTSKVSLTESENLKISNDAILTKQTSCLSKIKRIQYKNNYKQKILIYVSDKLEIGIHKF